jgi:hypothetical protein
MTQKADLHIFILYSTRYASSETDLKFEAECREPFHAILEGTGTERTGTKGIGTIETGGQVQKR